MTISHLRFGPRPVRSTYLVSKANFVGCHQSEFLDRYSVFDQLMPGGTFLLNTAIGTGGIVVTIFLNRAQRQLVEKRPRFFVIDAHKVAHECGMRGRINTIMQTCFFAISGILPREQAIDAIKESIRKAYGKKGTEIVQMNLNAVDHTLSHLSEVQIPDRVSPQPQVHQISPSEQSTFCGTFLEKSSRVAATKSRSVPCLLTALFRPALLVSKSELRPGGSRLGWRSLYPMRQMRPRMPARCDSQQSLRSRASESCTFLFQVSRGPIA